MKTSFPFGPAGVMAAMMLSSCETTPPGASGTGEETPIKVVKPLPPELKDSGTMPAPTAPGEKKLPEPPVEPPEKKKGTISQMDLGTLFELQGDNRAFLVDVRPAFWYGTAHIPGAISLPLKSFDAQFPGKKPELDAAVSAGKVIVLYCTDEECPDGRSMAHKLAKEGYSSSVYTGGWKEWQASGL